MNVKAPYHRDPTFTHYPLGARQALDLGLLATAKGYLESLERTLGRRLRLSPALRSRLKRIRSHVTCLAQPIKSNASMELLERARPYQAWLQRQGFELWPVQIRDAAVLAARGGGLLAFEPRTGKTRTAYAACLARGVQRTLVVADAGPIPVWGSELTDVFKLAPEQLPTLCYAKDLGVKVLPKDRQSLKKAVRRKVHEFLAKAGGRPLVLGASFKLLAASPIQRPSEYFEYAVAKELLRVFRPGAIIVDEAHHATDRGTRHGHILSMLRAPILIAVTGTPTNGRSEVQTTIPAWLSAGWHRKSYPWRRHVRWPGAPKSTDINALPQVFHGGEAHEENLVKSRAALGNAETPTGREHLRWNQRTMHMLLERAKKDPEVAVSLRQAEPIHSIESVELDPDHEAFYQELVEEVALINTELKRLQAIAEASVPTAGRTHEQWQREVKAHVDRARAALQKRFKSVYHRLSIASTCPWDPRLLLPDGRRYVKATSKFRRVLEIVGREVAKGRKVVVLTHHRAYSDALLRDLDHLGVLDCTRGLTGPEKKALEVRFWNDPSKTVLVLNGAAAGESYDFAVAEVMVVADLDERLTKLTQSMHRISGPRQKGVPQIIHVLHKLAAPNGSQVTVDEDVFQRLTIRKGHADLALSARGLAELDDWQARAARLTG